MPYQGRLPYAYKSPYNTTLDQGTQTVPSLAFLGDTNNGLFSPATDNVAITTNGSEKLRVTDVGNVGIGITNPDKKFIVYGSGGNFVSEFYNTNDAVSNNGVYIRTLNTNSATYPLSVNSGTNGSNQLLLIRADGNIGIGTTNPITTLDIRSSSSEALYLRRSDNANAYGFLGISGSNFRIGAYIAGTGWGNIILNDGGGGVGIGTTNPVKSLDVRGEATFGAGVTISDLSWGKDTNQLVYTFSGVASGVNPADGTIALVSPNTNPSATRIGSLVFGNKVSGPFATSNPGLKAGIECGTNTNVANAADTGGLLNFYTKPDNVTFRVQMTLNSNGILTTPYQPAFLAFRNTALSHPSGWQLISNDILTESYDVGPVYSTSTNGRFVAPVTGKYMFYAGGYSSSSTSGERYAFGVKINNSGSPDFIAGGNYSLLDSPLAAYQVVLHLNANDYVELHFFSAVATTLGGGTHPLYWGGYLLG
jgi:hypothetical protein